MHLELGQVAEGVAELEAALALGVEDINAWHTRMDAEKLLAQVGGLSTALAATAGREGGRDVARWIWNASRALGRFVL